MSKLGERLEQRDAPVGPRSSEGRPGLGRAYLMECKKGLERGWYWDGLGEFDCWERVLLHSKVVSTML